MGLKQWAKWRSKAGQAPPLTTSSISTGGTSYPSPDDEQQRQILIALQDLPSPDTNEFLVASRKLDATLRPSPDLLGRILKKEALDQPVRFKALYLLLLQLRRQRDYREYRQWVDRFRSELARYSLFHTFEVVYQRSLGEDRRSMESAIREASRAQQELPGIPGVLHQYAELVATSSEQHHNISKTDLESVDKAVRRAIAVSQEPQPHYWTILARLQAAQGEYIAARRSIAEAIELEPSAGQDYALRQTEICWLRLASHLPNSRRRRLNGRGKLEKS